MAKTKQTPAAVKAQEPDFELISVNEATGTVVFEQRGETLTPGELTIRVGTKKHTAAGDSNGQYWFFTKQPIDGPITAITAGTFTPAKPE